MQDNVFAMGYDSEAADILARALDILEEMGYDRAVECVAGAIELYGLQHETRLDVCKTSRGYAIDFID